MSILEEVAKQVVKEVADEAKASALRIKGQEVEENDEES